MSLNPGRAPTLKLECLTQGAFAFLLRLIEAPV